jgi:hypothetical protein
MWPRHRTPSTCPSDVCLIVRLGPPAMSTVLLRSSDAEKCEDTDLARELDEALHLGSSGLETLGAIRKTLIEDHGDVKSLVGSDGWKTNVIAFVDKAFGR